MHGAFGATINNCHRDLGTSFIRDENNGITERVIVWIACSLGVIQDSRNGRNALGIMADNTTRSQTGVIESSVSSKAIAATAGRGLHRRGGSRSRSGG